MATRQYLRDVKLNGFRLRTWDPNRSDRDGKSAVGYELIAPDSRVIFKGEDFFCSPLHAIDSDSCLAGILSFLTLRPGDTDRSYFDHYTPEQLDFARTDAEGLSIYACEFDHESDLPLDDDTFLSPDYEAD